MDSSTKRKFLETLEEYVKDCKSDLPSIQESNNPFELGFVKGELSAYKNIKYLIEHNLT